LSDDRDLTISLILADDDPALSSDEYQAAVNEAYTALQSHDLDPTRRLWFRDSKVDPVIALGDLHVVLAKAAPYLGTALASWFAGRASRKVRLKVGDVEVEAHSMKEVDQLLEKVRAIKKDEEPKRIING
jgi:Xaa-Pro aminopeptidase